MPTYKHRLAVEIARGLKAFLNLDMGTTWGVAPDPDVTAAQLRQSQEQVSILTEQVSALTEQESALTGQVSALTEQESVLSGQVSALTEQASVLSGQVSALTGHTDIMREQLENGGREISRLHKLTHKLQSLARKQSFDKGWRIAEENRRRLEEVSESVRKHGCKDSSAEPAVALYLNLMKRSLKNSLYADEMAEFRTVTEAGPTEEGIWPEVAHTMIGFDSLDAVQRCVEDAIANDIPGDVIETGVWRGGTTIFMQAILKAYGVEDRNVWVADSFEGLPPPDAEKYPHDAGDISHTAKELAISLEQVRNNFKRYGLLDDNVKFLKGWFSETLPEAPIEKLAVARLDGDMYESTMDALVNLYPKLSVGGYLIVDDYGAVPGCRQAVHDYREKHGVEEEIQSIDWTGIYWQRTK